LPEDAPPRLGEPEHVGPPTPTPKEKITGTAPSEEDGGLPGGMLHSIDLYVEQPKLSQTHEIHRPDGVKWRDCIVHFGEATE
jgi:hypothetical protein